MEYHLVEFSNHLPYLRLKRIRFLLSSGLLSDFSQCFAFLHWSNWLIYGFDQQELIWYVLSLVRLMYS